MSEFTPQPTPPSLPDVAAPATPPEATQTNWLTRKWLLGLTLPWLAGVLAVLLFALWFLFLREPATGTVDELAFGDEVSQGELAPPPPAGTGAPGSQLQDVAAMIGSVKEASAADREAISRLAGTVRAQNAVLEGLRRQLGEMQAQNGQLATRLSVLEARPVAVVPQVYDSPPAKPTRHSPTSGMRLDAVQDGMAWVNYQGKTWAVQVGDRLGRATVTGIDAQHRQVQTSAGVIR